MLNRSRKIVMVTAALVLALLGSGVLQSGAQAQAASIQPSMTVTLESRNSNYSATLFVGYQYSFLAIVENTGNVPLQVVANLATPDGWALNESYDDCPTNLAAWSRCTFTWKFTPQVTGQVYLRVYTRGYYTDSSGNQNRITQSPAFLFNVGAEQLPPLITDEDTSTSTYTTGTTTYVSPSMAVTLTANDRYLYGATLYADKPLIFRAKVKNTGNTSLEVVANLTVPPGWDVDENKYSDCPTDSDGLEVGDTCTVSWYFTPQGSGQLYLRVYVRGYYTNSSGITDRITQSPAFSFIILPER